MHSNGRLALVDALIAEEPPRHLYHYTSAAGLIGICSTRTMWASGTAHLNDVKEQSLAPELLRLAVSNRTNTESKCDALGEEIVELLHDVSDGVYSANRQIYIVSLSTEPDLLSQWRAYCPSSGGYSLGLPSAHLRAVASEQGFILAPCVYENGGQHHLVAEILDYHLKQYREGRSADQSRETATKDAVLGVAADIARYGPLLKHFSFSEEREWRLISEPKVMTDPRIGFHVGSRSVVPHFEFALTSQSHPYLCSVGQIDSSVKVFVGPTADQPAAQFAIQALLLKYLGPGCGVGPSSTTYRG